jgi:hypothetical protein
LSLNVSWWLWTTRLRQKMTFYLIPTWGWGACWFGSYNSIIGFKYIEQERERDTHTHKTWVVCLFDVEIYCIIKRVGWNARISYWNAPSSVGQGNGNAQNVCVCMYVGELLPSKIKTKQSYKRSLQNLHVQLAFSFFTWLFSHDL